MLAGRSLTFWHNAARPHALGQSLAPYLLGTVLALGTVTQQGMQGVLGVLGVQPVAIGLLLAAAGIIGVAYAHLGLNLFDDYFDYRGGAVARREELLEGGMRSRMGKCAYLKTGVTLSDTRKVAILFLAIAGALGLLICAVRGWEVLLFAACALLLGIAYSGPPLRLSYHGLGELVVGIVLGPLVVISAYFVVCGRVDPLAVFVSLPTGLLAMNILNAHAVMDLESDKAANRTTFAVLVGSQKAGALSSVALVVLSYGVVLAGVLLGFLPWMVLLVLLTLPMAVGFFRLMLSYARDNAAPFAYRRWMGPMENWERVVERGTDWFMIRWYLSRNLLMAFVLILAVTGLSPWYLQGPWG
jgi:1,4-dihydroxy-2-naphthoate octaprenyltransferase